MHRLLLCISATLMTLPLTGCFVEVLTTTAIQGELAAENVKALKRQTGQMGESMGQVRLKQAIDTYQAEKGYYPGSLAILSPNYIPQIPEKADGTAYGYDPATGRILDSPPTSGAITVTAQDRQNAQAIREAINQYGLATGYYPDSLAQLVPRFMQSVPKTTSGHAFAYDPPSGTLYHPAQLQQQQSAGQYGQPAQRRGTPVGGAGPLGEQMTAIGMQQELNGMSNAGTSRARGTARGQLNRAVSGNQRRQEQALQDLDY